MESLIEMRECTTHTGERSVRVIAELPIVLMVLKHRASRLRGASHPPESEREKVGKEKKEKERKKEKKRKEIKPTFVCLSICSLNL